PGQLSGGLLVRPLPDRIGVETFVELSGDRETNDLARLGASRFERSLQMQILRDSRLPGHRLGRRLHFHLAPLRLVLRRKRIRQLRLRGGYEEGHQHHCCRKFPSHRTFTMKGEPWRRPSRLSPSYTNKRTLVATKSFVRRQQSRSFFLPRPLDPLQCQ